MEFLLGLSQSTLASLWAESAGQILLTPGFPLISPGVNPSVTEMPQDSLGLSFFLSPGAVPGSGSTDFLSSPPLSLSVFILSEMFLPIHFSTLSKFYKKKRYWLTSLDLTAN